MEKEWNDPLLYQKMLEPHATKEDAAGASQAFLDAVAAARARYRICDVVAEFNVRCLGGDGDLLNMGGCVRLGNSMEHEALSARLLGSIQQWRKDTIGRLLAGGK